MQLDAVSDRLRGALSEAPELNGKRHARAWGQDEQYLASAEDGSVRICRAAAPPVGVVEEEIDSEPADLEWQPMGEADIA